MRRSGFFTLALSAGLCQIAFASDLSYHYPTQTPLSLDDEKLGLCMALVSLNEPKLYFSKSEMHCIWRGPEDAKASKKETSFFDYLAGAHERTCDYATGQEDALEDWVLAQPDNSIDPIKIFRQSLALNHGNIWNAILSVHEVVRNNARFAASSAEMPEIGPVKGWNPFKRVGRYLKHKFYSLQRPRYYYESTPEKRAAFFNKFIDIRGDLTERGPDFRGDHAGSWYRIWGAMLYRLHFENDRVFSRHLDCAHCPGDEEAPGAAWSRHSPFRKATRLFEDWATIAVCFGDEFVVKYKHGSTDDPTKYDYDVKGGLAMHHLLNAFIKRDMLFDKGITGQGCGSSGKIYLRPRQGPGI